MHARCACCARRTSTHSPLKFEIDPKELLGLYLGIEAEGQALGAIYHSHVRSRPYPSQTDINFAASWPGVEWIIVGLAAGAEPEVRSYLIEDGSVREVSTWRCADGCSGTIVCPTCGRAHAPSERFCESCGMPLVHPAGAERASERASAAGAKDQAPVRDSELVKVALAKNQPEAGFIAGLLLEEGIPCLLRSSIGGYSPMIGPREVLVHESVPRPRATP